MRMRMTRFINEGTRMTNTSGEENTKTEGKDEDGDADECFTIPDWKVPISE